MENVELRYVDGHIEIIVQGQFFVSCDNYSEAKEELQDIENMGCNSCPFIKHNIFCNLCKNKCRIVPLKRPVLHFTGLHDKL